MEGISVAKAIASRTRQVIDADQELIATGAANVTAGLFRAFPVAGGFSRTAVNYQAGARTGMASAITAVVIAGALVTVTHLLSFLPRAVLAAVVVVAVVGLIDVRGALEVWRIRPADGVALAVTFAGTLLLGVELGIAVGVAASLGMFIWRTANPHTAELGRVEGTTMLRNVTRYATRTDPRVAVLRIDGPLYFANAKFVEDRVLALISTRPELRHVVLDAAAVGDVDASGVHTLTEIDARLGEHGVTLHLATVRGPVRDVLTRAGLLPALVGEHRVHGDVDGALLALDLRPGSPLLEAGADERAPGEQVL
jgi:SulP family sulfate permease